MGHISEWYPDEESVMLTDANGSEGDWMQPLRGTGASLTQEIQYFLMGR